MILSLVVGVFGVGFGVALWLCDGGDDDGWFWLDFSRAENGRCCLLSSVVFWFWLQHTTIKCFFNVADSYHSMFFLEKLCGRFFFRFSFSLVGIWCVCLCLVHIRFYICVGHLFGIGHIKLKWLGLEGWPLENQNRCRFIRQSSFNDLSGIFIACKFATIHQYLCCFRRIL